MRKILFDLILTGLAFAQQYFPISALHVDDILWYQGVGADSLGF